jgi:diguanylate cyclase (GGDEF)-like protein/PAS domain S-box-containing protein
MNDNIDQELARLRKERGVFAEALATSNQAFIEKVREFSIIKRIADTLRWNTDRQRLFEEFVNIIIEETHAENCSFWLLEESEEMLHLTVAKGQMDPAPRYFNNHTDPGRSLAIGKGAAGWVARHRQSLRIEDVEESRHFVPLESPVCNYIRSLLALPVTGENGSLIGVFNLSHPEPGMFTTEHERVFRMIADQAGLAFTNCFLVERIRLFNRELEKTVSKRTLDLQASEERYAMAADAGRVGVWDWDLASNYMFITPKLKDLLGYSENELENTFEAWMKHMHPDDRARFQFEADRHLEGKNARLDLEYRMFHKDGNLRWFSAQARSVRDEDNRPIRLIGTSTDITDRKHVEEKLAFSAFHDPLTKLPNRSLFLDRLRQAIKHTQRYRDYLFSVLILDLDHFKLINDSFGHLIGDRMLKMVAKRLEECVRPDDTVARLGGDEFALLLENIDDPADAKYIANRILKNLKNPFEIDTKEVFSGISIGITLSSQGYDRPEDLLRDADTAMHRAKEMGRSRFVIFDKNLHVKVLTRLQLENDLRQALNRFEIGAFYQPIVDLRNGTVCGFEALARWRHPTRGLIRPSEFIPIAEETGMIVQIGERILREACHQLVKWQNEYTHLPLLSMSINLSTKQFLEGMLMQQVTSVIDETGIDPRQLKFEITESLLMEELKSTKSMLTQLRHLQVQLLLDDFGTGYSSLSYLHSFPLNVVKIDGSFIRNLKLGEENSAIVKAIKMLAMALKMEVVAEGIETEAQLKALREFGCEFGQGYLFAPPLDRKEVDLLLQNPNMWQRLIEKAQ